MAKANPSVAEVTVDAAMATAVAAGAVIVKAAHDTFWGGYSGYFQDPDGPCRRRVFRKAGERF